CGGLSNAGWGCGDAWVFSWYGFGLSGRGGRRGGGPPPVRLSKSFHVASRRNLGSRSDRQYDSVRMIRRLGVSVLIVAVLAPVLSGDAASPALVPRGVTVAGVPVGGMSNEQAQLALRPAFAQAVQLVFTHRSRW